MNRPLTALALGASLMVPGCGRLASDWDWNKAVAANTLAAYQAFLKDHPDDERAPFARGRVLAMEDDQAWSIAKKAGTAQGFREYLRTNSGGIHALQARAEIAALSAGETSARPQ